MRGGIFVLCYDKRMKIEWNKVTWYSKAIALGIFVLFPIGAFILGIEYGALVTVTEYAPIQAATEPVSTVGAVAPYYTNVAEWQADSNNAGFSISYPIDFPTTDNYSAKLTGDWSLNADGATGIKAFTLTIPKVFEPQTNFADATLTVGHSADKDAITNCVSSQLGGSAEASSTATINGIAFTVFHSSDAGAGNLYDTTSYRALNGGQCYAVEYTIHSSQIANYPASYNLQPLDEKMLTDVLDRIVGTFKFQ